MSTLRIGVLGCASIARRSMIPAIQACGAMQLVGVASRSAAKAEACAAEVDCAPYEGYQALLDDPGVDAVYIPLPPALHEEWACRALDAGKHALVEKSFTTDAASTSRVLERARSRERLVVENFLFPHHSQTRTVRDILERGEIGELQLFRSTFSFPARPDGDIRYSRELGGGALLDAGAYVLRATRMFLGGDVTFLGSTLVLDEARGVDVFGTAQFRNGAGQAAQVAFGIGYQYQCTWEFLGAAGRLVVPRAYTPRPGVVPTVTIENADGARTLTLSEDDYYANMCRYFAAAVSDPDAHAANRASIQDQAVLLEAVRTGAGSQS